MVQTATLPAGIAPRLLDRGQAAAYLGVSPSFFSKLVKSGRLPRPVQFGARRRLWDLAALNRRLDQISDLGTDAETADAEAEWLDEIRGQG